MRIMRALFVRGLSTFYFDDQKSITEDAFQDGFAYIGDARTPGFYAIRQTGECISVLLQLENGSVAVGDCVAAQYSGAGGRESSFLGANFLSFLDRHVKPLLEGREANAFLANAGFFDAVKIEGRRLHAAIRYGVTQALLDAAALANHRMKVEVLCTEYSLPVVAKSIPLMAQSGDDRYADVDKMILKGVDVLPHGPINNVPDKLGYRGEKLEKYIRWLVKRVEKLSPAVDIEAGYQPDLHIDVHGTIGLIFDQDAAKVANYIASLEQAAEPLNLYIEDPVDAGSKDSQIEEMGKITSHLACIGSPVKLVADEWCNTYEDIVAFADAGCCHMVQIKTSDLGGIHSIVDAVIYCNEHGMEAYQGCTCNETDVSARTCAHVALAARPMRMLVKSGMGFDDGMNIVHNELHRTVAILKNRELRPWVTATKS